jgi:hypothetical protein
MAGRRTPCMEPRALLGALHGTTTRSVIPRATGLNRRTIDRYRTGASAQGLLEKPLPPVEDLPQRIAGTLERPPPPQTVSAVEPYRDVVMSLPQAGVAGTALLPRVHARGDTGPLASVDRFLPRLEPRHPRATGRVERAPGREAQGDVGEAGLMRDPGTGALRQTWAFVRVPASSRQQ